MKRKQYNVVFTGKLSHEKRLVQSKLAAHFKMDVSVIERFMKGKPFCVKKDINYDLANRLKNAFLETGAICYLVEVSQKQATSSDFTLAPEGTNILEDTQETIRCPNCNLRQKITNLCDSCGIVFDKFYADLKKKQMIYIEGLKMAIKDRRLYCRRQVMTRRKEIRMANERRSCLDRRKPLSIWDKAY